MHHRMHRHHLIIRVQGYQHRLALRQVPILVMHYQIMYLLIIQVQVINFDCANFKSHYSSY